MTTVIGVDIGGSQIKAAAFSEKGDLLHQLVAPTDDMAGEAPPRFAENVRMLVAGLESLGGGRVERLAISAPGLAARDGRSIAYMPGRMHGLENFDWSRWLE